QSLYLVRRGGPQSGVVRPPQTGIAASASPRATIGQTGLTSVARNAIPSHCAATITRKCAGPNAIAPPSTLAISLKNTPLWMATSLDRSAAQRSDRLLRVEA